MKKEVSGNSLASAEAFTRELLRLAEQLIRWSDALEADIGRGGGWKNMTIKPPRQVGGEWLMIVRYSNGGEDLVAFVSARSLIEVLRITAAKLENQTITWKADNYA